MHPATRLNGSGFETEQVFDFTSLKLVLEFAIKATSTIGFSAQGVGLFDELAANEKLAKNTGMIASFSRALTEGLSAQQSDVEFNAMLEEAITSIHAASVAG